MDLREFETEWRTVLSSILEELTEEQFRKLVSNLEEIPQGKREGRPREEITSLIIQYYGTEESIELIDDLMDKLPRQDAAVQQPLRDMKDELEKFKEQNQGGERVPLHKEEGEEEDDEEEEMDLRELETEWRTVLSSILDELTVEQFRKLVSNLEEIPQGKREGRPREEITSLIIQYYGTEESIELIDDLMDKLPRQDAAVQQPLRDMKDELEKFKEQNQGGERVPLHEEEEDE
ncbi:uncharacterized protein LOC117546334 [Gymnodraco acuticeps]|uniref:Uncharacterized protein LOC117546334 n=1 Tax=Gymnodraco acuticeps TaxID=8218 RepID=A0A6P8U6K1_GYMAC|nr:uncharacterized protein LOC117546334 [Gymnodraco acuticeps]XP_034072430.1 uncharacterized protein LOC117546334 [Gymnodraco acuticeps]